MFSAGKQSGDVHEKENEKTVVNGLMQGRTDCKVEQKKALGFKSHFWENKLRRSSG